MAANKLYQPTRDNIIADPNDADENRLDQSRTLNRGTVLTIVRGSHPWGKIQQIEYCTVQIRDEYFNIPARVLAKSIMPKRS